jgi:hypothetical protein
MRVARTSKVARYPTVVRALHLPRHSRMQGSAASRTTPPAREAGTTVRKAKLGQRALAVSRTTRSSKFWSTNRLLRIKVPVRAPTALTPPDTGVARVAHTAVMAERARYAPLATLLTRWFRRGGTSIRDLRTIVSAE